MYLKSLVRNDRFWLFSSLIGMGLLYLNLIWRTTGDIDRLTVDSLSWGAIVWLLWQKRNRLSYGSDPISSFLGLSSLVLILVKTLSLVWFESVLISVTPICLGVSLALVASGVRGIWQYKRELFLAWFLFFSSEAIGFFVNNLIQVTVLTAKFSTLLLYYFGFNVANQGAEVILYIPDLGVFQASVNYSCTGMPMILLMLKLALLLVSLFSFPKVDRVSIPLVSVAVGFLLGVIRVCILTLVIPNSDRFDYWHGDEGSQIFSTIAIIIFSGYCYWKIQQQESSPAARENNPRTVTSEQ